MSLFQNPNSFVASEVKRTNRVLFLTNASLLALALFITAINFPHVGYFTLALVGATVALVGWNLTKWYRRVEDERKHPLMLWLGRFGDPVTVGNSMDREIALGRSIRLGPIILTQDWFILKRVFETRALSVHDFTWVYKKVTSHSVNFIPVGSSYKLVYYSKSGHSGEVGMADRLVDKVIAELYARNPNARYGFSK